MSAAAVPAGRIRPKTIGSKRLTRDERDERARLHLTVLPSMPTSRSGCAELARPCPFVRCSMHLYLSVHPVTGAIKLNFPHLGVDELAESCALDVADRGGLPLEQVGAHINLTRERVRQLQETALAKLRALFPDLDLTETSSLEEVARLVLSARARTAGPSAAPTVDVEASP